MGNSFYVQLSGYLLLEYIYGDNSTTYISNQVKLARIKNNYFDGQVQFLNTSPSQNITQNVLNYSTSRVGNSRWAYLNTDVPTPYISSDSNLVYTDLSQLITSAYVVYDTIRVHILSGYRLEDLDGLIIQAYAREAQTSLSSILTNNVFLNSDARDILNPKPILLGDGMYDRYIEVLIPSVKKTNLDFYANPTNPISIGYQYSSDNHGLLYESGIYVSVYEISSTNVVNGNTFFNTSNQYDVVVNQEDIYSSLTAVIEEADDGDYFRYYPSYDGNFILDFLNDLNASGGNYAVINDIDVYEQVGSESILTFSFSQLQQGSFDQPIEWRPIINYADSAVSFSIDYTVRIFNRQNGFQIIRRASTTSFSPKKYGKRLERIALANQTYPLKVYNKVFSGPSVTFSTPSYDTSFKTVYVPVFYDTKQIVVQTKSLVAPTADTDTGGSTYFGQGDARIYLSNFDTYVKFNIHKVDNKSGSLTQVDLTLGTISLVFTDAHNKQIIIPMEASLAQNSLAIGQIIFNVSGTLKNRILYDASPKIFSIISQAENSTPTIMYTGSVDNNDNISNEQSRISQLSTQALGTPTTISTSSNVASVGLSASPVISMPLSSANPSLLTHLINIKSLSIPSIQTQQVLPPVIPNFSVDSNAISVKNGFRPMLSTTSSLNAKLVASPGMSVATSSGSSAS